jgi:hypothetical protein
VHPPKDTSYEIVRVFYANAFPTDENSFCYTTRVGGKEISEVEVLILVV